MKSLEEKIDILKKTYETSEKYNTTLQSGQSNFIFFIVAFTLVLNFLPYHILELSKLNLISIILLLTAKGIGIIDKANFKKKKHDYELELEGLLIEKEKIEDKIKTNKKIVDLKNDKSIDKYNNLEILKSVRNQLILKTNTLEEKNKKKTLGSR